MKTWSDNSKTLLPKLQCPTWSSRSINFNKFKLVISKTVDRQNCYVILRTAPVLLIVEKTTENSNSCFNNWLQFPNFRNKTLFTSKHTLANSQSFAAESLHRKPQLQTLQMLHYMLKFAHVMNCYWKLYYVNWRRVARRPDLVWHFIRFGCSSLSSPTKAKPLSLFSHRIQRRIHLHPSKFFRYVLLFLEAVCTT